MYGMLSIILLGCKCHVKVISEDERGASQILLYAEKERKQVWLHPVHTT